MKVASATRSDVDIAVMHEHAKTLSARPSVKAAIAMTIRTQGKLRLEWLMNVCLHMAGSRRAKEDTLARRLTDGLRS